MGKPAQERIVRKLDLGRFLSEISPNPSPNVLLEQYTITQELAADILYLAAYTNGDIVGKAVLDLGCGTGRLGLGAAFLGAKRVVGIDLDKEAIAVAATTAKNNGLKENIDWIIGDIETVKGMFDTVVQNPPFGIQKRGADRKFLEKALEVGSSIYSIHSHPMAHENLTRKLKNTHGKLIQTNGSPFIKRFVEKRGGVIVAVYAFLLSIPHMFKFHKKTKCDTVIDLYLIEKKENDTCLY